ncbi:MAG TPA: DUF4407 domain-containing protein, partial [Cytophagales bacterium]|nr:DUF4407 domain-containing protein [Cytophagales bacterium]
WVAVPIGCFWGMLVFNLDRFIVSTIKKSAQGWAKYKQVVPRLLLAIFLALIISKPLELRIFKQEIEEKLHYIGLQKLTMVEKTYAQKISTKRDEIQQLNTKTEHLFALREKYYEDYKCECEGSCGTGAKGVGSECLRKERKYHKADIEYQQAAMKHDHDIALIHKEITRLEVEKNNYKLALQASFSQGLMARLNALNELPAAPSWAIVLLLVCIEITPLLAKLLSPYGPYDHLLKAIEYEYEINEIASISQRNQQLNHQLTLLASIEQEKVEQQITTNKVALRLIEDAHQELVKEQLDIWVEQERMKLRAAQTHTQ